MKKPPTLDRTKRLILAACRVWELKRDLIAERTAALIESRKLEPQDKKP